MARITITNQAEFDALPDGFVEYTVIDIKSREGRIIVRKRLGNSSVVARENSSVEARGNSSVVARENSSVEARGNSSVEARGNSSVEAWGNSSVVAWGNSSVVARENSSVEARENSSVEAWENSSVVAWGNSSVEAWGNCCTRIASNSASAALHGYSTCYLLQAGNVDAKSKNATIIRPQSKAGVDGWLEREGIVRVDGYVVLYKRVSSGFLTQEGTPNETSWVIGSRVEHPAWSPGDSECGCGKFHGCSRPYFCDEFRSLRGDRYIVLRIGLGDLHAWDDAPDYPHKIAFRAGLVLYECDRFGKEVRDAT